MQHLRTLSPLLRMEPEWFVHEVCRFYPFFPLVAARGAEDFDYNGYHFPAGTQTILDLYGTNRDPRAWQRPNEFLPERFRHWPGDPFTLIPQGGGDHYDNHRCAGEWVSIELIKVALHCLVHNLGYTVPPQDLRVRLPRIPALPESGYLLNVKRPAIPGNVNIT